MIILGVDPGTIKTGYGIIKFQSNLLTPVAYGTVQLGKFKSLPEKLESIYDTLDSIIKQYCPDEFSIETAFYGKNVQSALKIGYARGVSMLVAIHNKMQPGEYSPREIKKAVVGSGAASKEQVNYMIKSILNLKKYDLKFDESDALAAAVCHAFRLKTPANRSKNWKSFVEAFPERIIG